MLTEKGCDRMEDINKALHQCIEKLFWDFVDIHDFMNGRKGEITLVASIIVLMASRKRLQLKDIASTLNVSNSTVTDYINYLENKEFVKRIRGEKDRREVFIELTDKGKGWIQRNMKITRNYMDKNMSRLSPEEQATLVMLMSKFMGIKQT
jgi:DNA-binding MarR family transcriptional regulator